MLPIPSYTPARITYAAFMNNGTPHVAAYLALDLVAGHVASPQFQGAWLDLGPLARLAPRQVRHGTHSRHTAHHRQGSTVVLGVGADAGGSIAKSRA